MDVDRISVPDQKLKLVSGKWGDRSVAPVGPPRKLAAAQTLLQESESLTVVHEDFY